MRRDNWVYLSHSNVAQLIRHAKNIFEACIKKIINEGSSNFKSDAIITVKFRSCMVMQKYIPLVRNTQLLE